MSADFPIPSKLNRVLALFVVSANVSLLLLASRYDSNLALVLGCAFVFSHLMLTNYAIMHEALHWKLQPDKKWNYALGALAAALFPLPFSLGAATHHSHHERNRTDSEMFDLYYEGDRKWLKMAQWYSIMTGLFWVGIAMGSMLFALFPAAVRMPPFSTARTSAHLAVDLDRKNIRRIQVEAFAIVVVFAAAFYVGWLKWQPTLILYSAFGFNWSTRQYVTHAFTSRHVIEGTDNMKTSLLMTWIFLHEEWDLNHHRRPEVPWIYLPSLPANGRKPAPYLQKYLSLWKGPRLTADRSTN